MVLGEGLAGEASTMRSLDIHGDRGRQTNLTAWWMALLVSKDFELMHLRLCLLHDGAIWKEQIPCISDQFALKT